MHAVIIKNILYFIVMLLGFIIYFISVIIYNKKYKILNLENIIISYLLFIIFFLIFGKIGYIIINRNIIITNNLFPNYINFFIFGYAFISGYIGILIHSIICSKLFKCHKLDIMHLFIPNVLLLYSILKICCYINGCCSGIIPIQIIESITYMITYIYICYLEKSNKDTIKISIILFGLLRLILSLFRIYNSIYQLIIVEIICLIIIFYGITLKTIKK